jgi:hypothetical protein
MDKMKPVIVIKIRAEDLEDTLEELKETILELKCLIRMANTGGPMAGMVDRVKLFFCIEGDYVKVAC